MKTYVETGLGIVILIEVFWWYSGRRVLEYFWNLRNAKSLRVMSPWAGKSPGMEAYRIIESLEELAEKFGIKVRYELISPDEELPKAVGGLCRFKGEYILIINSKAPASEQIRTFVEALKSFELDQIYIKPALRELLDEASK